MSQAAWRIELLGELRALSGSQVLTRFYTHKIGGLLAYLALHQGHPQSREALADLFWPNADSEQGRMSLRTALASLRRQLEPQGAETGSMLLADRLSVGLQPGSVATDVAEFDLLLSASEAGEPQAVVDYLLRAIDLYRGELLPGYNDDWVTIERARLSEAHFEALRRLATALEARGDFEQALDYARRLVLATPLDEAAHTRLIRLYIVLQRPSAAYRQYQQLERILREELNATPSPSIRDLIQSIKVGADSKPEAATPDVVSVSSALSAAEAESADPTPAGEETFAGGTEPFSTPLPAPLPTSFTPFFGREEEIAEVIALLDQPNTRMLTLTGLGGAGKTRLALEVARRLQNRTDQALWFISLADLADAGHLAETLRSALHLEPAGHQDPLQRIANALHHRPTLLVLDNFEHLLEAGAPQLHRLLQICPQLTCLLTSRLHLGLMGEREYALRPLPTPTAPGTPQHLMTFAGVQLFVSRAQATRPDFGITGANAQAVAQLCHALDGLPLALELAAARSGVLTPAQMLHQLTDRFGFLVARHRDALERHRTLRAALEWSYEALGEGHRRLLCDLSVFRGGWTLEAAESVCGTGASEVVGPTPRQALEYLMDLRDASLILTEERDGVMRFRMLETVREYALERLSEEGGTEELVRQRHLAHFLQLAEEHNWGCSGAAFIAWRARIDADYENIRTAVVWSLRQEAAGTSSAVETALRLTGSLGAYWILSSHYKEGLNWLRQAITIARMTMTPMSDAVLALALMSAGYVAFVANEFEAARRDAEEGLTFARKAGDLIQQIQCLAILAQLPVDPSDPDRALQYLEEAQSIAIETENPRKIAFVLYVLGRISYLRGEEERALSALEQSLAVSRRTNDGNMIAHTAANLASLVLCRGDVDLARALSAEALETYNARGFSNTRGFNGIVANVQAFIALHEGNTSTARAMFLRQLEASREAEDGAISPHILLGLAVVACAEGDYEAAAELLSVSAQRYQELGLQPEPLERSFRERILPQIRAHLNEAGFQAACVRGLRLAPDAIYRTFANDA